MSSNRRKPIVSSNGSNKDDSGHQESAFRYSNSVYNPADPNHSLNVALLSIMDKHMPMLQLMSVSVPNFVSSSLYVLLKLYAQPKESMKVHLCCGNCSKPGACCSMPECNESGLPIHCSAA